MSNSERISKALVTGKAPANVVVRRDTGSGRRQVRRLYLRLSSFLGASPNFFSAFFMAASKLARAFFQALSLSGTAHSPMPLHLFSPGFSPQPPSPAHSLCPLHWCSLTVAP